MARSAIYAPPTEVKEELMKTRRNRMNDELRPEYDLGQLLKGGVRGKYAKRYHAGTNLVLLDPDVRKAFRSERAVNDALRLVIELRKVGSNKPDSTLRILQPEARADRGFQFQILAFSSAGKRTRSIASPHRVRCSVASTPERCSATLAFQPANLNGGRLFHRDAGSAAHENPDYLVCGPAKQA